MLAALANHLQLPCPMKQKRRPEADINREASRRASCPKRHCRLEEKGRGLSGSAYFVPKLLKTACHWTGWRR
jgi:hypothetical protein